MNRILIGIIASIILFTGCIEDDFTTSPSSQPHYSTDTLRIGDVFTAQGTPTHSFIVYNRNSKGIIISNIRFRDPATSDYFRVNVDGLPGKEFNNVEIRAKDSIYVLVEATLPENGFDEPRIIDAPLDFTVNGVTSTVVINISGHDVNRINGETLTSDTHFTSKRPYLITDSLVVAPGITLTIEPGTTMYFHDKASLKVRGTILSEGFSLKSRSISSAIAREMLSEGYLTNLCRDNGTECDFMKHPETTPCHTHPCVIHCGA